MAGNNVNQLNLSLQSIIFIVSFIGAIIDSKIIDLAGCLKTLPDCTFGS